jgi:hypothetical protein
MSESNVRPAAPGSNPLPYAAVPHALAHDHRLTPRALALAVMLLKYARSKSNCWPSNARLARDMRCTDRTVRNTLALLRTAGWIEVRHGEENRTGRLIVLAWRESGESDRPLTEQNDDLPPMRRKRNGRPGRSSRPTNVAQASKITLAADGEKLLEMSPAELLARRTEYLRSLPYNEYLETQHWRDCRARAIDRAGGACQICNTPGDLDVHHRTYARLGEEADADLVTLCRPCHTLFHGRTAKPVDTREDAR